MNSRARMLAENADHYVCHDGEAEFRVPKQGLSEALHAKIRALGPQKLADGGTALSVDELQPSTPAEIAAALAGAGGYGMPPVPAPTQAPDAGTLQAEMVRPPTTPGEPTGFTRLGTTHTPLPPAESGHGPLDNLAAASRADPFNQLSLASTDKAMAAKAEDAQLGIRPKGDGAPPVQTPGLPAPAPKSHPPGRPAPPAGMVDYQAGSDEARAAVEAKGRAEAEQARATAVALGETQKQLQLNALEQKQTQDQARAAAAEMMGRYKAASDEMRNIDTTVDPGRWWASRSTPQKITGIIGLALGALGAGSDGINRAAGMITQAIDRDLEAQKAEHGFKLQKARSSLDAAQNAFGMQHQIFQNDLAAAAASKATLLELADNQVKRIAATAADPIAKAQAAALSAELLKQKGKFENDAANTAFENAIKWQLANQKATGLDPKSKDLLQEVSSRNQTIQNNGKKLLSLIDQYGTGELITPGVEGRMRQLATDMAVDAAKVKDPSSVVRPSEMQTEIDNIFSPGWLQRSATAKAKIQAMMDNTAERAKVSYAARGVGQ